MTDSISYGRSRMILNGYAETVNIARFLFEQNNRKFVVFEI